MVKPSPGAVARGRNLLGAGIVPGALKRYSGARIPVIPLPVKRDKNTWLENDK